MKRSVSLILVIVFITFSFIACKKGSEDPAFTLLTRTNRISGDWKAKDLALNKQNIDTLFTTADQHVIQKITFSEQSFSILKDGTWEQNEVFELELDRKDLEATYISHSTVSTLSKGTWSFMDKVNGSYKNKERVILSHESIVTTTLLNHRITTPHDPNKPVSNESPNTTHVSTADYKNLFSTNLIYDIIKLKAKEMKWKMVNIQNIEDVSYDSNAVILESDLYQFTETIISEWVMP